MLSLKWKKVSVHALHWNKGNWKYKIIAIKGKEIVPIGLLGGVYTVEMDVAVVCLRDTTQLKGHPNDSLFSLPANGYSIDSQSISRYSATGAKPIHYSASLTEIDGRASFQS